MFYVSKNLALAFLALTGFQISIAAYAEDAASSGSLQLQVPASRLQITPSEIAAKFSQETLALGVSSWFPSQLNLPSQIPNTSPFSRATPAIYINYLSSFGAKGFFKKFGINWMELDRRANLNTGFAAVEQSQSVHLVSARAGAEYDVLAWSTKNFTPYVGLSILPTVAFVDRSSLDNGSSYFGLPFEMALGSKIKPHALGIPWSGVEFDLGVLATLGRMNRSSVNAWGASLGMRVML